jgi:uncharacterized protein (TIGR02001 family)
MKKIVVSSLAALAFSASSAFAADPPKWDFAAGAGVVSDYLFRGVTQSNHKPSFNAYFEPRYNVNANLQLYAGIGYETIRFANDANSEIDFYGGIRPTLGKLALDVGVWYYWYPGGTCYSGLPGCPLTLVNGNFIKKDVSFWEVYFKPTYNFSDSFALGATMFYSPSFLNSGADGFYLSGTAKYTFPAFSNGVAMYVSGELGYQWLGTSDAFYGNSLFPAGIDYKDYATWNVGVGWTWKVLTVDLRYTDTDLSKADCNAFTGDHTAPLSPSFVTPINQGFGTTAPGSNWCGARFTAKLSVDITSTSFK